MGGLPIVVLFSTGERRWRSAVKVPKLSLDFQEETAAREKEEAGGEEVVISPNSLWLIVGL